MTLDLAAQVTAGHGDTRRVGPPLRCARHGKRGYQVIVSGDPTLDEWSKVTDSLLALPRDEVMVGSRGSAEHQMTRSRGCLDLRRNWLGDRPVPLLLG